MPHVLCQPPGGHRELDPRAAVPRVDGSFTADDCADELGQPRPVPTPRATRDALELCQLAPEPKASQPLDNRVRPAGRGQMDTCSSPPDMQRRKGRRHDRLEVRHDVGIAIREVRLSEEAASGNVVSEQAHQLEAEAGVMAKQGTERGTAILSPTMSSWSGCQPALVRNG